MQVSTQPGPHGPGNRVDMYPCYTFPPYQINIIEGGVMALLIADAASSRVLAKQTLRIFFPRTHIYNTPRELDGDTVLTERVLLPVKLIVEVDLEHIAWKSVLGDDGPRTVICFGIRSVRKRGRKYEGYVTFSDLSELLATQPYPLATVPVGVFGTLV